MYSVNYNLISAGVTWWSLQYWRNWCSVG